MGGGETRAQQAEVPEVRGQRLAVLLDADHRLPARLGHVHLDPDLELAREVTARREELVTAVHRDGGAERRPHPRAIERPRFQDVAAGGEARLVRRRAHRLHRCPRRRL